MHIFYSISSPPPLRPPQVRAVVPLHRRETPLVGHSPDGAPIRWPKASPLYIRETDGKEDVHLTPPQVKKVEAMMMLDVLSPSSPDPHDSDSPYHSSSDSESDQEESDKSRTKTRWLRKGEEGKASRSPDIQRNKLNELARDLILEAFRSRYVHTAFIRSGVSEERLQLFAENPHRHGPKMRNTWLDKSAETTTEILLLPWNRSLIFRLSALGEKIVSKCRDPHMFPTDIDWNALIRARVYRIVLDEIHSRPIDESETVEEALERWKEAHNHHWGRCLVHSIRRVKFEFRCSVSAIMVQVSQEREDNDALEFWSWVLQATHRLGKDGMSDEETEESEITQPNGRQLKQRVREVMVLSWRHPHFRDLYTRVDELTDFEKLVFSEQGRARLPQMRVAKVVTRAPPPRLYRSFYREGYLEELQDYEVAELKLSRRDCNIPTFQFGQ
ncbi:hypothetical protein PM082_007167 [Marasmius tenuissimus]|nr:hypothetical protein PM082_007167 [Marasmius tenuissimus]